MRGTSFAPGSTLRYLSAELDHQSVAAARLSHKIFLVKFSGVGMELWPWEAGVVLLVSGARHSGVAKDLRC